MAVSERLVLHAATYTCTGEGRQVSLDGEEEALPRYIYLHYSPVSLFWNEAQARGLCFVKTASTQSTLQLSSTHSHACVLAAGLHAWHVTTGVAFGWTALQVEALP